MPYVCLNLLNWLIIIDDRCSSWESIFRNGTSSRYQNQARNTHYSSQIPKAHALHNNLLKKRLASLQKSLTSFFGIGEYQCNRLMARHHIHPTAKIGELANRQVLRLTTALTHMKIENDLRRQVLNNIKRLKDSGTYRGRRHAIGLPVRGQNTRTQVWSVIFDVITVVYPVTRSHC